MNRYKDTLRRHSCCVNKSYRTIGKRAFL